MPAASGTNILPVSLLVLLEFLCLFAADPNASAVSLHGQNTATAATSQMTVPTMNL